MQFVFSTDLMALLPWLNIAIGASILMALCKLFAPYWTTTRLLGDAAINLYWLGLLALLFRLPQVFSLHWPADPARQWEMPLYNWQIIIAIIAAITAYDLFKNIQRYWRAALINPAIK